MATKEIANREGRPVAANQNPDMCIVGQSVVPFDISRDLSHSIKHSPNVNAKGVPVITVSSVIQGVEGNAGMGVTSGVSQGGGFVLVTTGATSVNTNSLNTARHLSECQMNCPAGGGTNGTKGVLYISQSAPLDPAQEKLPCNQPPKTSPKLAELEALKKKLASVDPDRIDEYLRLDDWDKSAGGWIDSLNPGKDANQWARGASGAGRAVLGFGKDLVFGLAGLAVWAGKKQMPGSLIHDAIDNEILAENIRLGNVCWESVKDAAGNVLNKLVEPITEPWKRGEHVEALVRAGLEIGTLAVAVADVAKAAKAARAAGAAGEVAEAARGAGAAGEVAEAARGAGAAGEVAEAARGAGAAGEAAEAARGAGAAGEAAKAARGAEVEKATEAARAADGAENASKAKVGESPPKKEAAGPAAGVTVTKPRAPFADDIANGHAYDKHVIKKGEFPEVNSRKEFADVIDNTVQNPTHQRSLTNGRTAYFDMNTNTLVIHNPAALDRGTAFRPSGGLNYFNGLK